MRVFEMCSSINGKYLIAGEFEKQIQIWDTECNEKICDIKTHFLGGGKRLTVSNSGKYFSAVNYGRYGIELYSTENHMLLWQNKTIKQIQCVYFSADDSILYAINNDGKLYSLSVSDGNIESIEKNICYLFLSESGMLKLSKTNELIYGALKIPSSDFNYCDIYPADEVFYYSLYGAKGLFCCDAAGTVLWHNTKTTENIIEIAYNKEHHFISAIEKRVSPDADTNFNYYICSFEADTGKLLYSEKIQCDKNTYCFAFADNGKKLITNAGTVLVYYDTKWHVSSIKYEF